MSACQLKIIPVILCGGSGKRLKPISSEVKPKQFLSYAGSSSLLQQTTLRAQRVCAAEKNEFVFVTRESLRAELAGQLRMLDAEYACHVLCEPSGRNTAAAVALAARYVEQSFGKDALMWVLPSDHVVRDEAALEDALCAAAFAAKTGAITTFGITPDRAETDYGYIRKASTCLGRGAYLAAGFAEKPDAETARRYIKNGDYLWNSGMFVFQAASVLKNFSKHAPEILAQVDASTARSFKNPSAAVYVDIPSMPFDKAVMEHANNVAVVPCDIGWSDIGSWRRLFGAFMPKIRFQWPEWNFELAPPRVCARQLYSLPGGFLQKLFGG